MKPITTTLASILAIIFAFALVFGMSNDTLAQGADDCTGDCDGPDDDGDGIPNGEDEDYAPPRDGTGKKAGKGNGKRANQHNVENGNHRHGDGACACGNDDCVPARDGTEKYGKGRANHSTLSSPLLRAGQGNRAFRGKVRFFPWGRMRAGNEGHAAPTLNSGQHLRKHSRGAFTGTQDGIGKQMRLRRGRR